MLRFKFCLQNCALLRNNVKKGTEIELKIFFYFQLVVMIGIRKSLDFIFTQRELKILDDVMPEPSKKHADDLRKLETGEVSKAARILKALNCCK